MRSRRTFLKETGLACAIGGAVPSFWGRAAAAAGARRDATILVVVELTGGNDGLNTVVPHGDDDYRKNRPTLAVAADKVVKLDDRVGLNDALKGLLPSWERGEMAVVQQVGYPEPNRSHFESMAIWQGGRPGLPLPTGWLGRAADALPALTARHVGPAETPLGVRGIRAVPRSITGLDAFQLTGGAVLGVSTGTAGDPALEAVRDQFRGAEDLMAKLGGLPRGASPPQEPFEARMDVVRRLIVADPSARVYYTSLDGFDTHAAQLYAHRNLLATLGKGVAGLLDGLQEQGMAERTAVMIFSEFGRRLKENGSGGTDHGSAGPVLLVGPGVKGGLHGPHPDLGKLDEAGDPLFGVDFRDVYAAVLRDWLGVDPAPILGERPASLGLFA